MGRLVAAEAVAEALGAEVARGRGGGRGWLGIGQSVEACLWVELGASGRGFGGNRAPPTPITRLGARDFGKVDPTMDGWCGGRLPDAREVGGG
jgi:hypothetical protein